MPALATMGTVASDSPEFTGPMMTSTLSTNASCLAKFTAFVGSPPVSRVMSSSLRPLMPPAALISSTANCTPWFSAMAAEDSAPVSEDSQPMRIVESAPAIDAENARQTASNRALHAANDLSIWSSSGESPLLFVRFYSLEYSMRAGTFVKQKFWRAKPGFRKISRFFSLLPSAPRTALEKVFRVPEPAAIDAPAACRHYSRDPKAALTAAPRPGGSMSGSKCGNAQ
jgi:hypothetical protein